VLVLLWAPACGTREPAAEPARQAAAERAPEGEAHERAPATQRMLGTWRMNLAEVPDTALTADFLELKRKGDPTQVRIEYTVTDREFILRSFSPQGPTQKRWFYEVLKEDGNTLMLERTDESGQKQQIPASVEGDTLRIGTGNGIVPLQRAGSSGR
jgi:hypothetical protein